MQNRGYYGVSFPFRIGIKGGVAMSGTNSFSIPHIEESITQILNTHIGERPMEYHFGSNVSVGLFEPSDESAKSLIKYEICKALRDFEPRIEVDEDGVELEAKVLGETETLNTTDVGIHFIVATIPYRVKDYSNSTFYAKVNIGGGNNE